MATDTRGHTVPAGTDAPKRADLANLSASINDFVRVANTTARDTLAAAVSPSTTRPLIVWRADAGAGRELEITSDGTNWSTIPAAPAAWSSYTPVTSGFTVGNGSLVGRYQRFANTVHFRIAFTAGSTSAFTAGATLIMSLPTSPNAGYGLGHAIGQAFMVDASAGSLSRMAGVVAIDPTTPGIFLVSAKDTSATVTNTSPWTWANGDQILVSGSYETT